MEEQEDIIAEESFVESDGGEQASSEVLGPYGWAITREDGLVVWEGSDSW